MFLDLFVLHFRMANKFDMDELNLDENEVMLAMSNEVMGFSEYMNCINLIPELFCVQCMI